MFFSRPAGHKFVHRGDPSSVDFDVGVLSVNSVWTPINLSSIIPVGSKAVLLYISVEETQGDKILRLAEGDITGNINVLTFESPLADNKFGIPLLMAVNAERKIQYWKSAGTWIRFDVTVSGWFI